MPMLLLVTSGALAATVENALRACMGRPPLGDAATREGQREPHPGPQAHGTLLVSRAMATDSTMPSRRRSGLAS